LDADKKLCQLGPADAAGRYIYQRGCANGKRVQVNHPPNIFIASPPLLVISGHQACICCCLPSPSRHSSVVPCPQANMGAKNHAVVLPDANPEAAISALTGAAFGAAGQRCMAISAVVFVGGMDRYRDALVEKARSLKVRAGAWMVSRLARKQHQQAIKLLAV
jgi:hypothetical protein